MAPVRSPKPSAEIFETVMLPSFSSGYSSFLLVVANAAGEVRLAGEAGLRAEGVEIKMERNRRDGLAGQVFVGQHLGRVERLLVRVDVRVNVVR
jgi:hypothetical protein